jgi:hypothetical protein
MNRVSLLKVNIHTDGYFGLSGEDYEYERGNVCEWWCDPNDWSFREILGILKHIGYPTVLSMYYMAGGKLKVLKDDEGAMLTVAQYICNGKVDLYVFAKHVKCANVWGESMNADVDVGESSTKRRRWNSFPVDPSFPTLPSDLTSFHFHAPGHNHTTEERSKQQQQTSLSYSKRSCNNQEYKTRSIVVHQAPR